MYFVTNWDFSIYVLSEKVSLIKEFRLNPTF